MLIVANLSVTFDKTECSVFVTDYVTIMRLFVFVDCDIEAPHANQAIPRQGECDIIMARQRV